MILYLWVFIILPRQIWWIGIHQQMSAPRIKWSVIINWNQRARSNHIKPSVAHKRLGSTGCTSMIVQANRNTMDTHQRRCPTPLSCPLPKTHPCCLCSDACGWLVAALQWKLAMENNHSPAHLWLFVGCWGSRCAHLHTFYWQNPASKCLKWSQMVQMQRKIQLHWILCVYIYIYIYVYIYIV